jgi:hypothetical protein
MEIGRGAGHAVDFELQHKRVQNEGISKVH